jgi:two-component system, OmpR family, sensor histidine kinase BaeS
VRRIPGSTFSLPIKLAALAAAVQLATVAVLMWLSGAIAGEPAVVRALAYAVVLSPPVLIIIFLGRYIIGRMTNPLIAAYSRIAAGDFQAQLPPLTAGSDFIGVRQAFAAMAAALDRSVQQLRDADHDRRRLFADLAHELATPTSTLLGIAHALRKGEGDTKQLLDLLVHETARLERLIADVREVAHLEDPTLSMLLEPCDIGDLANKAIDSARIGTSVDVRSDTAPSAAQADPLRISQVLANLIDNAIRYANGGIIAVTVKPHGESIVMRVEDSGTGVPDELLPQLGRRLLRVDPARARDTGGHGLGLSIVRAIVARHQGEITFGRAALGGLSVEIRLPARDHNNNTTSAATAD